MSPDSERHRRKGALPATLKAAADAVARVAVETGSTPTAIALAWLRAGARQSLIPLIGARTLSQLQTTLAGDAAQIDPESLAVLDAVAKPELGFPHELLSSSYLRRFAFGDPRLFDPANPRC